MLSDPQYLEQPKVAQLSNQLDGWWDEQQPRHKALSRRQTLFDFQTLRRIIITLFCHISSIPTARALLANQLISIFHSNLRARAPQG